MRWLLAAVGWVGRIMMDCHGSQSCWWRHCHSLWEGSRWLSIVLGPSSVGVLEKNAQKEGDHNGKREKKNSPKLSFQQANLPLCFSVGEESNEHQWARGAHARPFVWTNPTPESVTQGLAEDAKKTYKWEKMKHQTHRRVPGDSYAWPA